MTDEIKIKKLRTEYIKLPPYCLPYHEIEITYKGETKILNIDSGAWRDIQSKVLNRIKKDWDEIN